MPPGAESPTGGAARGSQAAAAAAVAGSNAAAAGPAPTKAAGTSIRTCGFGSNEGLDKARVSTRWVGAVWPLISVRAEACGLVAVRRAARAVDMGRRGVGPRWRRSSSATCHASRMPRVPPGGLRGQVTCRTWQAPVSCATPSPPPMPPLAGPRRRKRTGVPGFLRCGGDIFLVRSKRPNLGWKTSRSDRARRSWAEVSIDPRFGGAFQGAKGCWCLVCAGPTRPVWTLLPSRRVANRSALIASVSALLVSSSRKRLWPRRFDRLAGVAGWRSVHGLDSKA